LNTVDGDSLRTYRSVGFMASAVANSVARRQILQAALKRFAHCGYSAASVQQIVDDAKVSKPTLYYYFRDKAELFQALVHEAHDERYRLMVEAAKRGRGCREKLIEIQAAVFDYFSRNRELMRILFATAFAAPGEIPESLHHLDERRTRNFEFIHTLMKQAQRAGELDRRFDSLDLAFGFYGLLNFYLMAHLVMPCCQLNRKTAERVVELFLAGALPKKRKENLVASGSKKTKKK
jgi:AcrR family transcriptional regulator